MRNTALCLLFREIRDCWPLLTLTYPKVSVRVKGRFGSSEDSQTRLLLKRQKPQRPAHTSRPNNGRHRTSHISPATRQILPTTTRGFVRETLGRGRYPCPPHCGKIVGVGGVLLAAKDQVDHGEWIPWLKDRHISHDIAKRLMRLHEAYPQKVQFALFDSVNAALKALPAKADPGQSAPKTTPQRDIIELVDREELVAAQQQIEDLRQYALKAEADLTKALAETERAKAELDEVRKKNHRICEYPGCEDLCDSSNQQGGKEMISTIAANTTFSGSESGKNVTEPLACVLAARIQRPDM